jgi:hypothetical protein
MKRAYSTLISAVPLSIASFSVVVATGINAAMWKRFGTTFGKLRADVKADIKELRDDMREIRQMLSRRWF